MIIIPHVTNFSHYFYNVITATAEMIRILQEYGEVVLCVGSSINVQNVPLFLTADCRYSYLLRQF